MSVPSLIAEAVEGITPPFRSEFSHSMECEGAKFHSPTPLILHEVDLIPWDQTAPRLYVKLCGTCRDNLWVYQQIMLRNDGDMTWELQRCFGNRIRGLAKRAWDTYKASQRSADSR